MLKKVLIGVGIVLGIIAIIITIMFAVGTIMVINDDELRSNLYQEQLERSYNENNT